jgi:hypothetical protein
MEGEQLFLEGLQPVDIERVMGNPHQRAELSKLEQFSEALGWLVTSYAIRWGGHPNIRQTKGVDQQGYPYSRVEIE